MIPGGREGDTGGWFARMIDGEGGGERYNVCINNVFGFTFETRTCEAREFQKSRHTAD